jgi:hypothetical protein
VYGEVRQAQGRFVVTSEFRTVSVVGERRREGSYNGDLASTAGKTLVRRDVGREDPPGAMNEAAGETAPGDAAPFT